jgi:hypothetical protein
MPAALRPIARPALEVAEAVVGGVEVALISLAAPLVRRRYVRWGATPAEVGAWMAGDELVPDPKLGYTRALTIAAPPHDVWRWLAQIGQGRGGLYSYDALENLVGCRIHSTDRVLPEHQDLAVGDLIRMGPDGYPCFRVVEVDPGRTLVLLGADPRPPHELPGPQAPAGLSTWQWSLDPRSDGRATRLLVRQRLTYPDKRAVSMLWHLVEPVAFVMERRMLLGLRERAEGPARSGSYPAQETVSE